MHYISFLQARNEALQTKHSTNQTEDNRKCAVIMQRHSANDDEEIKFIKRDMKKFLTLALQHYLRGLKMSNEHDLLIFRAVRELNLTIALCFMQPFNFWLMPFHIHYVFLSRYLCGWKMGMNCMMINSLKKLHEYSMTNRCHPTNTLLYFIN